MRLLRCLRTFLVSLLLFLVCFFNTDIITTNASVNGNLYREIYNNISFKDGFLIADFTNIDFTKYTEEGLYKFYFNGFRCSRMIVNTSSIPLNQFGTVKDDLIAMKGGYEVGDSINYDNNLIEGIAFSYNPSAPLTGVFKVAYFNPNGECVMINGLLPLSDQPDNGGAVDNPGGDNPGGDNPGGDNPSGDSPPIIDWGNDKNFGSIIDSIVDGIKIFISVVTKYFLLIVSACIVLGIVVKGAMWLWKKVKFWLND